MKTSKWLFNLLLISSLLFVSNGFATAQQQAMAVITDPVALVMEVTFNGTEGNFLVFTVKTLSPAKSYFSIRNDAGNDLHREVYYEGNNLRRFKIEKGELRSVQFILAINRKQFARTFKVSTSYQEQTDVEETTVKMVP
ncbi:MAG: hypothetical protein ACTHMC_07170 [Pseudobacter sp.]|uniref:hypothetical protein n=1 Tax=Pseudobacter sp. TaxID=2045420 RepID=UPI003F7FC7E8